MKKIAAIVIPCILTFSFIGGSILYCNYHCIFIGTQQVPIHSIDVTKTLTEEDAHAVVKLLNGRYFTLENKDRVALGEIFKKYGAEFPLM